MKIRNLFGNPAVNKIVRNVLLICLLVVFLFATALFSVSSAIVDVTEERILTPEDASLLEDVDCILVLGAGVNSNGVPSQYLQDRLDISFELYFDGVSDRLLMSGDHGTVEYDEVNTMKSLAVEAGIDADVVFCDHAGFSTYESIYRARDIFKADKIVIVTQEYHLHRALYIAEKLGVEAYGVSATLHSYGSQPSQDVRETAARFKDFFYALLQPKPTYLGEAIPISGNASLTDG